MADWEFSDEEINEFFAHLDQLAETLSEKERALLRAILKAAVGGSAELVPGAEQQNFTDEFAAAFKQNTAESIVAAYSGDDVTTTSAIVKLSPNFIVR